MRFHLPTSCAIGLAFAATMAGVAGAQQSTQQHIPVRKEAADTTKKDTTVAPMPMPAPAPAPMPAPAPAPAPDTTMTTTTTTTTVEKEEPSPWYFGIGGGVAIPMGHLADISKYGPDVTVMVGWQKPSTVLGFRIDGSWDHFQGKDVAGGTTPAITDWSGNANLTLNFPMGEEGGAFYLLGGVGYDHFTVKGGNSTSKPAIDGGAGIDFGLGGAKLFIESRYVMAFTDKADVGSDHLSFVPIIIGFKF